MRPMLNIAVYAVRKASNLITKHYETHDTKNNCRKSINIFIANLEQEVERLVIEIIHKFYPQHIIFSRNSSSLNNLNNINNTIQWILDPLDGVVNFIKHFPHFAISIAVRIKGCTEIAVIYDPMRNELFTASRGHGAQLNGYRLRSSTTRNSDYIILATSFQSKYKKYINNYVTSASEISKNIDFRFTGSMVLDLAYIAAGRIDGFFGINFKPWSLLSGELIVREAGGLITDFVSNKNNLLSGNIAASNSHVIKTILSTMRDGSERNINLSLRTTIP